MKLIYVSKGVPYRVGSGAGLGGAHVSRVQVSMLLPASLLPDVTVGEPWA
jgi:hypothetical protein